ncbi:MAG: MBL fold metallo-hydrolase [Lachnospiraceae bacterium]|jgi:N-acyl homoserine lactone hydrolase|nr:MBL fold metallo-hydrolase [Lachnospiraceae bacterium]
MKIIALKYYKNGEMQEAFAMGGSLAPEKIDMDKRYPSSLQNYLIDTGKEVILIDTGLPKETPDFKKEPDAKLYVGEKIQSFPEALEGAGYKAEDVDKIVVTHKHPDHTGELRMFPNAKVFISRTDADALELKGANIIRVDYTDGPYHNFVKSQKIADSLVMLPAPGHTKGNSIAVLEYDGKFWMFHGDISYTDEALRRNELSVVFEDKELARESEEKVREFIMKNPTVYLSTHTPEGIEHLEKAEIMQL